MEVLIFRRQKVYQYASVMEIPIFYKYFKGAQNRSEWTRSVIGSKFCRRLHFTGRLSFESTVGGNVEVLGFQ